MAGSLAPVVAGTDRRTGGWFHGDTCLEQTLPVAGDALDQRAGDSSHEIVHGGAGDIGGGRGHRRRGLSRLVAQDRGSPP